MRDLIVKDQYLICQYTDQIPDQFLMVIAGGWAGCQKTIDIQKENVAIFFSDNTDILYCARGCGIWFSEKISRIAF